MPTGRLSADRARIAALPVLSRRSLNRATMHRQGLSSRWQFTALDAVRHLVGLQAQLPDPPYLSLWARVADFAVDDLTGLMSRRHAVRSGLMRATLHVVSAEDFFWLRPLMSPVRERAQRGHFGKQTAGIDLTELAAVGRKLLDEQPMNNLELRAALSTHWPDRDSRALMYSVHYLLPLVQVPPGGTWGTRGSVACTTDTAWLGRPVDSETSPEQLILRYLAAYGPATVKDMQLWSGLTRLAEVVDGMRPLLRAFADEEGRELFDLPDAPLPDEDAPAAVRFLPEYDNLAMGYADRSRIVDPAYSARVVSGSYIAATVLIDGFVQANWTFKRDKDVAVVRVDPLTGLSREERDAAEAEALRLLAFMAPDAETRRVDFI